MSEVEMPLARASSLTDTARKSLRANSASAMSRSSSTRLPVGAGAGAGALPVSMTAATKGFPARLVGQHHDVVGLGEHADAFAAPDRRVGRKPQDQLAHARRCALRAH